jgi:hypothetical protein
MSSDLVWDFVFKIDFSLETGFSLIMSGVAFVFKMGFSLGGAWDLNG